MLDSLDRRSRSSVFGTNSICNNFVLFVSSLQTCRDVKFLRSEVLMFHRIRYTLIAHSPHSILWCFSPTLWVTVKDLRDRLFLNCNIKLSHNQTGLEIKFKIELLGTKLQHKSGYPN